MYADATMHDPENICLLCGSCHDKVSRKHYSKNFIKNKYKEIQNIDDSNEDFSSQPLLPQMEDQSIFISKFNFSGSQNIIVYKGAPIISIKQNFENGGREIDFCLFDERNNLLFEIEKNVCKTYNKAYDFEVKGNNFKLYSRRSKIVELEILNDREIRIKFLHLKINHHYILITDDRYMCGVEIDTNNSIFLSYDFELMETGEFSSFIEIADWHEIELRKLSFPSAVGLETPDKFLFMLSPIGMGSSRLGILFATRCSFFCFRFLNTPIVRTDKILKEFFSKKNDWPSCVFDSQ